jgi:hypothetical protein
MLAIICLLSPARPSLSQIPEFSGAKVPTLALLVREVTPSVVNLSVHGRISSIATWRPDCSSGNTLAEGWSEPRRIL